MSILFKPIFATKEKILSAPINNGSFYVATDMKESFVDIQGSRIKLTDTSTNNYITGTILAGYNSSGAISSAISALSTKFNNYPTNTDLETVSSTLDGKFANYVLTSDLSSVSSTLNSKFNDYATNTDLSTTSSTLNGKFADYALNTTVSTVSSTLNSKFADYALITDLSSVSSTLNGKFADYALNTTVSTVSSTLNDKFTNYALTSDLSSVSSTLNSKFNDYATNTALSNVTSAQINAAYDMNEGYPYILSIPLLSAENRTLVWSNTTIGSDEFHLYRESTLVEGVDVLAPYEQATFDPMATEDLDVTEFLATERATISYVKNMLSSVVGTEFGSSGTVSDRVISIENKLDGISTTVTGTIDETKIDLLTGYIGDGFAPTSTIADRLTIAESRIDGLIKIIYFTGEDETENTNYQVLWSGSTVLISHNLGGRVVGSLYDENNNQVLVGLDYVDDNTISINLSGHTLTSATTYTLILNAGDGGVSTSTTDAGFVSSKEMEIVPLLSAEFTPKANKVYTYSVADGDVINFSTISNNVFSFRLYLTTPSQLITFNLPSNILWDAAPNFSQTNSLYMFVFEWNPILNKWLGNQLWKPVSLE